MTDLNQRATMINRWAARKTDNDLLNTLARVQTTDSTVIRAALTSEARKRGLL